MSNYPNQPPYQPPTPNSTTAIISLISGIVGMTILPFLGSIVAVITGHMAKNEIRKSMGQIGGNGMATAGLIMGYLVIIPSVICGCVTLVMLLLGMTVPFLEFLNY